MINNFVCIGIFDHGKFWEFVQYPRGERGEGDEPRKG